jgi:hypothetical protein
MKYSKNFSCLYRKVWKDFEYANVDKGWNVDEFSPIEFENLDMATRFEIQQELDLLFNNK